MVKLQRRALGDPDDVREIPYGRLETYDMGDIRIGRSVLQPGGPSARLALERVDQADRGNRAL